MKNIICYCSGGLGNRLKPLFSCYNIALLTNRKLIIVWEPTLRCLAPFSSIFDNAITRIPESDLPIIPSASLYMPNDAAEYEYKLNNLKGLYILHQQYGSKPIDTNAIINDPSQNIVVFSNTTLPDISFQSMRDICQYHFKPSSTIVHKVNDFWNENKMTPDIVGVHARGTDFEDSGVNADYYLNHMSVLSNYSFFLCSDSKEYEDYIKSKDSRHIITRSNKIYVSKKNGGSWSNNVYTPTESVQDSMVDLLLLSRTNFKIYHPNSSFAHLVEFFKQS